MNFFFLPAAAPEGAEKPKPPKGRGTIVITIAYDNYPFDKGLQTSWGFACVVDGLPERVLFDTGGDGAVLLGNLRKLEIDPQTVDVVVLSHAHHDHTGGLAGFVGANSKVKVFMPGAFPEGLKAGVRQSGATLIETDRPAKICEGAWTTGVLDGGIPEQGIYLEHAEGPIVVTGCAHPGIVRIAEAAKTHAGKPVYAVLGGFHMAGASHRQIDAVIRGLGALGVRRVAPSHCSGDTTRLMMREAFGKGYMTSGVGARLTFED